jgi:hypothetical protein
MSIHVLATKIPVGSFVFQLLSSTQRLGDELATTLGKSDGDNDGCTEGIKLGKVVGMSLGTSLGKVVGLSLGK